MRYLLKSKNLLKGKNGNPLQIAGPCSAETKEQVLETARRLKATSKVDIFRLGIWKPRTMPGSFEGVGVEGLLWMQEAKEETGLPVTVEVAKASHVDRCLDFGVDVLWIGARTTVSPFAMEELASALKGVDIPVMVKNPINPDLKLWIGGIERLRNAGISEIAAIHRGFSYLEEKYYRNRPQWQIPIALRQEMPDVPMICDPSHICGRRDILEAVSQKAYDLDFDGLMIESHITPDGAWTDSSQQITPEVYALLIDNLVRRDVGTGPLPSELEMLRSEVTNIDEDILNLLSDRMEIARKIGKFKKANNISIFQKVRWAEIMEKGKKFAEKNDLSEEFVVKHFEGIHDESINQQEKIMKR
ncbi:MAG TPA: 3-deoxy-7-phosphoheptulonate synthase [Saprospirales bacterium]|jgi:chorismate mutase|nr:bifunctional 3-deoxy-7-phosphoheptulonate synthase/chorismate mutase type II [Saprospiraceae bacterium]MDA9625900.1 bifunctional 3-deoxy-7-phosphoheptulonate synthase/chorismate mutase type II [bacterium]HAV30177.1 3-deoxy-7-phosphoheptulonate synthase [Saprospirales bacterium]HAW04273.1 3-deoxy-7-phosphoheptulonate synthase [Saprospirales bacterium]